MIKSFFISGTDTDVGKTIVSSILVKKLNASYFKPIQCGLNKNKKKDSEIVYDLCETKNIYPETYFFKHPVSPYVASKIEKKKIDIQKIYREKEKFISRSTIVEGAGGLYVPIKKNFFVYDLIKKINLPLILVCRTKVGTLNHTLMSLDLIKKNKINFFGLIFTGEDEKETIMAIKHFGKQILKKNIKVLGRISFEKNINKTNINNFVKAIKF